MKDFIEQFDWLKDSFDFDRDGDLDDMEVMIALNSMGVMARAINPTEEKELYELACAGVDITTFDYMDEEEKREAIEDAGLDPDDYDFD